MDPNSEPKMKSKDKGNLKYRVLGLMEKISTELASDGGNRIFLTLLEKILDFNDGPAHTSLLRRNVANMFFEELQQNSEEDFKGVLQDFENLFMPIELKKMTKETIQIQDLYEIARGGFGVVHLGQLTKSDGSVQNVAIKTAKEREHEDMLLNEAKIMARLDHENIVKLVTFQKSPLSIIMEYMELENIEVAVQNGQFTEPDVLKALYDVASGMEYMSEKKYVHRDLGCRNVFVDPNKVCKIGDFGFSRYFGHCSNGEIREKTYPIGMYNTPFEARVSQIFSPKTDVWSFGILVWELYQIVEEPWNFFFHQVNRKVIVDRFLLTGQLPFPVICPISLIYYIKHEVLNRDAEKRPNFTAIKEKITEMLQSPPSEQNRLDAMRYNDILPLLNMLSHVREPRNDSDSDSSVYFNNSDYDYYDSDSD